LPNIVGDTLVDHQSSVYTGDRDAKSGAIMSIKNQGDLHSKAELDKCLERKMKSEEGTCGESTLDIKIPKKKQLGNGSTTKQEI